MGEDGWSRKQFWAREVPRKEAPVCVCVCVHCTQTRGRRYWEFSYLISYIERFWEERPAFYRVSQKKVYNKLDRGRKKHLVSRCLARDQPGRSKAGEEKNWQKSVRDLFCVPPWDEVLFPSPVQFIVDFFLGHPVGVCNVHMHYLRFSSNPIDTVKRKM